MFGPLLLPLLLLETFKTELDLELPLPPLLLLDLLAHLRLSSLPLGELRLDGRLCLLGVRGIEGHESLTASHGGQYPVSVAVRG